MYTMYTRKAPSVAQLPLLEWGTQGGKAQSSPARFLRDELNEVDEKSPSSTFAPNEVTDHLLSRLQSGSHWLTAQPQAWLEGRPDAASDERFSVALAAWTEMERSLRLVFGYEGCVFGPDQRCPDEAPVVCDFVRQTP
jgi:hypothetical protein